MEEWGAGHFSMRFQISCLGHASSELLPDTLTLRHGISRGCHRIHAGARCEFRKMTCFGCPTARMYSGQRSQQEPQINWTVWSKPCPGSLPLHTASRKHDHMLFDNALGDYEGLPGFGCAVVRQRARSPEGRTPIRIKSI